MKEIINEESVFDEIVEGEYIQEHNRIVIHDIINMRTTYDAVVTELPKVAKWLNDAQTKIAFATKTIKRVKSEDDVYEVYKENADFETDGLIFTNHTPAQNYIYKWKETAQLTTDLVCLKIDGSPESVLLASCAPTQTHIATTTNLKKYGKIS